MSDMRIAFYDIETYKADTANLIFDRREYKPDSRISFEPPKKILDLKNEELKAERLAEWELDLKDRVEASILEQKTKDVMRAALHWTTGKVVCICASIDGRKFQMSGANERAILEDFALFLSHHSDAHLCGKSNHIFDDGFIKGRYMVNRIEFPACFNNKTLDINNIFGWGNRHPQHAKLDEYAIALNMGEKLAKGSDVAAMVENNEYDKIKDYCVQDVALTESIGNLFHQLGGWL